MVLFGLWGVLVAIILILMGIVLVFFLAAPGDNQPDSMAWTGIVTGIIFFIIGALLLFL